MAGALSLFLLLALFSLLQVTYLPPEIARAVTAFLLLPLVMDLMLISPSLPVLLLFFIIIPLLLTLVVIFRIALTRILKIGRGGFSVVGRIPRVIKHQTERQERKYGLRKLLAVSIGATMGPSTFVLSPYSVKYYGWLALPGMVLASVSSIMLAYGYSVMYYYSRKIGGKIVGGPSFVGNAFGTKHYLYIISRFTMWIGNVALAAFNLLIVLDLVAEYALPSLLQGIDHATLGVLTYISKILLFAVLSLMVLATYRHWEEMVNIQIYVAIAFLALFGLHMFFLVEHYHPSLGAILAPAQAPSLDMGFAYRFAAGVLASAAYVYLMVFGFQEVQSLGRNVKALSKSREGEIREVSSILRRAMVGGAAFSSLVFCIYTAIYVSLQGTGVEIPGSAIPSLDLARISPIFYAVTFAAITLGIVTTYVPAFVAALKHLRELVSDVFLVRVEELGIRLDPFIVVLFMGLLLMTNASYIIRLTDFAVLISLGIIAFSEYKLRLKVHEKRGIGGTVRIYALTAMITTIVTFFAITYQEVAISSVFFMMFSTLIIMFLSYDLFIVEMFAITMGVLSLAMTPPLVSVITEFASYGIATPTDIAIAQALTASLWILRFIFAALIVHVAVQHRADVVNLVRALAGLAVQIVCSVVAKLREYAARAREMGG